MPLWPGSIRANGLRFPAFMMATNGLVLTPRAAHSLSGLAIPCPRPATGRVCSRRHDRCLADLEGDDFRAGELEPVAEVDGISGKIASQMRGHDGSISRGFRPQHLRMVSVLAPRLLRPVADGAASADIAPLVADEGVLGEAGRDAFGVVGIGSGEVFRDDLRKLHDDPDSRRGCPGTDPA